ncbi:c-type cytochrome [Blastococcus sp. MG754426]|nr:c-type cytochrome [Blastococcus sp. MG754426]MCF6510551.1 c-type cytochrome [Blastococcus sp. MG754427]MCF6735636.1 c-type cytochrome [Blastococcus sp. KM273129]
MVTGRPRGPRARLAAALVAAAAGLTACTDATGGDGEFQASPERGRELLREYGCASCHQVPGVAGPQGRVGPPLGTIVERRTVAGTLPHTRENLEAWIQDPQRIDPGNLMPDLGVTDEDVDAIVAYLYSLGTP